MGARRAYVSALAAKTLRDVGITAAPVSVEDVCAYYAVTLTPVDGWPAGTHSAQWQPSLREIRFNAIEPPVRQRFSIAHELGHMCLGHEVTTFSASADPEHDDYSEDPDATMETEANQFAGELLLPPAWVRADWAAGLRAPDLVRKYLVSSDAAWVAAKSYRLLKLR